MEKFRVRIGLRDKNSSKYIGSDKNWEAAESALKKAAKTIGVPFEENEGEAAFYGPKIDFVVEDVIGREWQLGTVQVDYNLPERFNLSYIGSDNKEHQPVMIHRAPFGSLERFTGLLIEHFGGDFPTWLAPEQVRIIPLNATLIDKSNEIANVLKGNGIRVSVDERSDKLNSKIRRAEVEKIPHMFVIGDKEVESRTVSVRSRNNPKFTGTHKLEDAIATCDMCLKVDPNYADPYIIKGIALGELKRKEEAKEAFLKAKELGDERADGLLEKYK